MTKTAKAWCFAAAALLALLVGVGVGSVSVPITDILRIFSNRLFGTPLPAGLNSVYPGLVLSIRLPRVLLAFLTGAALSVSGTVMQSVLKNPLASSYGLGVSSGAGLGAALIMIYGLSGGLLGSLLLPAVGLAFGFGAVVVAVAFAQRLDHSLSNNTIILTGMVLSLFLNAILTTVASAHPEYSHQLLLWQLGSFSSRGWDAILILAAVLAVGLLCCQTRCRELDVMTFGEDQAAAMGVELKKTKWLLIGLTALMTGTAVSFVGIIGFVDLIAPHVVRRFFGSSHRWVLPMSALFGGTFMVLCDLAGRTLVSPSEIPVGSITALLGAPFFLYIYFVSRKRR